ncbi:MAG: DNA gyrase/topoisomerase IV subunit A [Bacteroidales bacterium]|nr:DNA gyrase/topoisomerase IV subunit A [Bacteroidales bacterium]
MKEDDENIEDGLQEEEQLEEAPLAEDSQPSGKYDRLLGQDSKKYKLSGMFKDWFLDYSSYVILQRAVPHIVDGLKPVQRRVLHAMYRMDDGRFNKVANIVGQAMQYHPHGDASILGALVQLGQKGFTVEGQGNWGNILTGDSNAAPRYIEGRLTKFAKEVVFDPKVTHWMTSYDGRNQEPTELPVRFPLLLAQGTEGIAVGMASKILPHNFNELLDSSIAILKNEPYDLYPDFPTGGYADCSKYNDGRRGGSVKVRAKIEKNDKNTITITEIPYGKTTHILIDSILKAKDKGKIRISKIEDMTTDKVDIVIRLPKDVSPDKTIDALYAFTDCETTIAPNACVIVDNKPQFLSVKDILEYDTWHTRDLLGEQLKIRLGELENDWHYNSLEKIFFEERVYKILEQDQKTWNAQLDDVLARMKEFQDRVRREITMEDIMKLVEKPVRKISKFDTKAVDEKIRSIEEEMAKVQNNLEHLTRYTIDWFKNLKKKYGDDYPRQTEITSFEAIAATKVVNKNAKLYANMEEGFVGIGLKKDDGGQYICDCSDISEIITIAKDGKYKVSKVTDKAFFWKNLIYVGLWGHDDERTIYNVVYRLGKSGTYYAKRFAITSLTRDKEYDITTGEPGSQIVWMTVNHNGEAEVLRISLRPRPKLKKSTLEYDFSTLAVKGKGARGNVVSKNPIARIQLKAKGVSTLGGKKIWYDADVQKLNEDARGLFLGEFEAEDKVLAIFTNGTFYTTSFDLSNRYQGEVLDICKFDPEATYTATYWDGKAKAFYVKRFSFVESDNTPQSFISQERGSYLVGITADEEPRIELTFGGKSSAHEPEILQAESFIGKKGYTAKGKKCSALEVASVKFLESPKAEDEPETDSEDAQEPDTEPVQEPEAQPVQEPETQPVQEPEAQPEPTPEPEPQPAPEPEPTPEPEPLPEPGLPLEHEHQPEPKPKAKAKPKARKKAEPKPEPAPIDATDIIDPTGEGIPLDPGDIDADLDNGGFDPNDPEPTLF